jgi:phosphoglycolate phosphatase-like HAD superfamily hydrolase
MDGNPSASIYIGDTKFDVECAKNAKVKSVLVGWSHYSVQEGDVKPDFIINDFMELENIIKSN